MDHSHKSVEKLKLIEIALREYFNKEYSAEETIWDIYIAIGIVEPSKELMELAEELIKGVDI